jgi:1,5-anhydro-D-fructose reductase (1,5-anhydro-D-mannitol-forming)
MRMAAEIGFGFIGASIWAERYMVPAVRATEGARPLGVFSTDPERGATFAKRTDLVRSYDSLDALLSDPSIDAVYISTTNDLHAPQAIAAARAGKHVLCEKPVALSVADGVAIRVAAQTTNVVVGVNHHLRGSATIVAMHDLLRDGAIGELVAARVFHARLLPEEMRTWRLTRPEAGAGVIFDITVHDADTIRYLLDDEIVEVTAVTSSSDLCTAGVEDSVMGVMRSSRGALVSFHDAFTVPHAGTGIELHGTTGSLIARDVIMAEPSGEVFLRRGDEVEDVKVDVRWPLYEQVVARFCAAVRGEGVPLTTLDDGISALAVALAVRESASTGRPVAPVI